MTATTPAAQDPQTDTTLLTLDTPHGPVRLEMRDPVTLKPAPSNVMSHSEAEISRLISSVGAYGFLEVPVYNQRTDRLVAGHARQKAAIANKLPEILVFVGDWDETTEQALSIALQGKQYGDWSLPTLATTLKDLDNRGYDTTLTGLDAEYMTDLMTRTDWDGYDGEGDGDGDGDSDGPKSDGSLLGLVNVTIADPKHQVAKGDVYLLGGKHTLICANVITEWAVWTPYLTGDDTLFCPYPGPFVALGTKADEATLILVQPDTYIAGHLLDRYAEIHGEDSVEWQHGG